MSLLARLSFLQYSLLVKASDTSSNSIKSFPHNSVVIKWSLVSSIEFNKNRALSPISLISTSKFSNLLVFSYNHSNVHKLHTFKKKKLNISLIKCKRYNSCTLDVYKRDTNIKYRKYSYQASRHIGKINRLEAFIHSNNDMRNKRFTTITYFFHFEQTF